MNADGSGLKALTGPDSSSSLYSPVWSPDGARIAFGQKTFTGGRLSKTSIKVMNADGSGLSTISSLVSSHSFAIDDNHYSICWSADGSRIAFTNLENSEGHIYTVQPTGADLARITSAPATVNRNISCSR